MPVRYLNYAASPVSQYKYGTTFERLEKRLEKRLSEKAVILKANWRCLIFYSTTKNTYREETLPYYKPEQYYPVNIGDVSEARY
ncbi:hypothetical protein ACJ72_03640 [Emergomyces africanus]|uniref:Uncharacterized protein n=1 Tax=Emergomyces africanus TaxID=1955775 RepID=A0A1B7NYZ5_9EURO|nr:hypothetical protein ACJ72_03640 [Emergomyces africanus]